MYNTKDKPSKNKFTKLVKKSLKSQDKIMKKGKKGVVKPTKKKAQSKDYFKKNPGPLGSFKSVTDLK